MGLTIPPEAMARSEPTSLATGIMVQICTTGISSRSISLLIAAPQRVLEPQVEVRMTPVTPADFQPLGDSPADACRVLHGGMGAAGGMDGFMELADDALLLQLTHDVQWHQAVGILIGEGGVVAGMNDVELLWVQAIYAFDGNRREASRPARLHLVRIALDHQPAVGDQRDHRRRQVAKRCGRFDVMKLRRSNLRRERLAANFCQEHIHGPLCGRLGGECVALDAARNVSFFFRSS